MVLVIARQRPDAVGAQELVLVEHPCKDAAEPLGIDDREKAAVAVSAMPLAHRVDTLQQLGHDGDEAPNCEVGGGMGCDEDHGQ